MTAMSDYLEADFLHQYLDGTVYLGLAVGTPFTDSSVASEESAAGYSRVALTDAFAIADEGGGTTRARNASKITGVALAGGYSDKVAGWGIFDALTAGNLLFKGPTVLATVPAGKAPTIAAGVLAIEAR